MKKVLNLILNQAGFVVVLMAILLVFYGIFELTLNFIFVVGSLLLAIFIMSQLVFRGLKK